jgi:hypothetical protein
MHNGITFSFMAITTLIVTFIGFVCAFTYMVLLLYSAWRRWRRERGLISRIAAPLRKRLGCNKLTL